MPRLKSSTPRRLDGSARDTTSAPKSTIKKEVVHSKRILRNAIPTSQLLGSEPLKCIWNNPDFLVPPSKLLWSFQKSGEINIFADSWPIFPCLPVLSVLIEKGIRKCDIIYYGANSEELLLDVALNLLPWPNATPLMEALCFRNYSNNKEASQESGGNIWKTFFKELAEIQSARPRAVISEYQDSELQPVLRGYQADAVAWMVHREETTTTPLNVGWLHEVADDVPTRGEPPLLYNKFSEAISVGFDTPMISSGGILADEMGLGKTVITLALILKHRKPIDTKMVPIVEVTVKECEVTKSSSDDDISSKKDSSYIESEDSDYEEFSSQGMASKRKRHVDAPECNRSYKLRRNCINSSNNPKEERLSSDDDNDNYKLSERQKNMETSLNADEELQLVPNKGKRGLLRSCLNEWYESKLAEVRCTVKSNPRIVSNFRCICGDDLQRVPRNAVKCSECHLYQHPKCVGYYKSKGTYICPSCWKNVPPVKSSATLIIVPPAICQQWESEVERHTPSLKCLLYSGGSRSSFVSPSRLADYDVVITTYPVLVSETYFNETSERQLRQESRFLRLSSPLTCVSWWRVVCDEAQQFESDGSKIRLMIEQLCSIHRWSVTGTPIQRGIADLFYLTQFMGLGPLDDKTTWTNFLLRPYLSGCKTPLLSVLNQVFWRSTKDSVGDELGLPEQTFRQHFLQFTAIEESFYNQEHTNSSAKFIEALARSKMDPTRTLDSLDKGSLKCILQPLLNLRQACTHAQVVSGINIASSTEAANLSELLTYLSRKTKQECEELLRRYVNGLNGIAGLHFLREEWSEALENYRTVFRLVEEYKDKVQIDSLQRIHALTSAAEIIEKHKESVTPTLRDDNLLEEASELERKYTAKANENLQNSFTQAKKLSSEIRKIEKEFETAPDAWWVPVIIKLDEFEDELLDKINSEMDTINPAEKTAMRNFLSKLRSIRSIEIIAAQWWKSLEKCRKAALSALDLSSVPRSVLVEAAVECHLRNNNVSSTSQKCDLCKMEKILLDLECELFYTKRKELKKKREKVIDGAETKGSWKPHNVECTLQIVVTFARNKNIMDRLCMEDAKRFTKLLDTMKKEFKQVRAVWTEVNSVVQAEDELNMSKLRFCFSEYSGVIRPQSLSGILSNETPDKLIYAVLPSQVNPMLVAMQAESQVLSSELKKKYGKMIYLRNLGQQRNCVPDPCPVCQATLEGHWCVLQCGHCYCLDCIHSLNARRVKCPVCREVTEYSALSFVDTCHKVESSDILVCGDFSTKIDAMVRTCLEILHEDSSTKILIFSTWMEVLKILEEALKFNNVKALLPKNRNNQKLLQQFRDPSGGVSALLLPLSWGSKGLNLIEATHVLLAEPILNPAEELQAIGRVHRIGQTRPTVVHRFLIKGTIEEKIHSTVSEAKDKWEKSAVTLAELQNLFVKPEPIAQTVS